MGSETLAPRLQNRECSLQDKWVRPNDLSNPIPGAGEFWRLCWGWEWGEYGIGLLGPLESWKSQRPWKHLGRVWSLLAALPQVGSLREEGLRGARQQDKPPRRKPTWGGGRWGVEPRGSNFLVVSWGNLEQDWRCLLSKQGKETPHPGR